MNQYLENENLLLKNNLNNSNSWSLVNKISIGGVRVFHIPEMKMLQILDKLLQNV